MSGQVTFPCDCLTCRTIPSLPTEAGEHRYQLDADYVDEWTETSDERWRWLCACGGRGRWTFQSPNVPYHAWRKHAGLSAP